ncbi:hypothetical protein [Streptomyces lavendulocolor]|uniref:hypothetical protein n=1 Tax=Streptomyces lavendulocolor TaxID=67316 RepID=UPI003C2B4BA4
MIRMHFRPKRRSSPYLALLAAALLLGPMTGIAQAQEVCTVNGTDVSIGQDVNGTPGNDLIVCVGVVAGFNIYGHGGDDTIITTDVTEGGIYGGEGNDTVETGALLPTGSGLTATVDGEGGDDDITTGAVAKSDVVDRAGFVTGGSGNDNITTGVVTRATVTGAKGADSITVAALSLGYLSGADDDDTITVVGSIGEFGTTDGGPGSDQITVGEYIGGVGGGTGRDRITSLAPVLSRATLNGGLDADTIQAQAIGLGGSIRGEQGDDVIEGLAGLPAEVLAGGRVNGGTGVDVCDVIPLGGTVTECP